MILSDLHIHSTFSDGKLTIPEIVDLYGRRGFGAIAITDHLCEQVSIIGKAAAYLGRTLTPATFPIYMEILKSERKRAWEQYRMLLIPGVELTKNTINNHRSAHILALGIEKWIDASLPPVESCARIHEQGGLAIAAHPVSTGHFEKQTLFLWSQKEILKDHFDAWEVASGRKIFDEVLQSGLPFVASSDMHKREQLSSWKTAVHAERGDWNDFKRAIKEQDLDVRYYQEGVAYDPVEHAMGSRIVFPTLGRRWFPRAV